MGIADCLFNGATANALSEGGFVAQENPEAHHAPFARLPFKPDRAGIQLANDDHKPPILRTPLIHRAIETRWSTPRHELVKVDCRFPPLPGTNVAVRERAQCNVHDDRLSQGKPDYS